MTNNNIDDDNLDDIDLNELFNDFNEQPSQLFTKSHFKIPTIQDELTENDCTAPRILRKRPKSKKKTNAKQMTMYDYASSISYKNKQFYSSLDNTITCKTIIKGPKHSLIEDDLSSSSISKKSKSTIAEDFSPDFIDKLLRYLDERSRTMAEIKPLEKP